MGKKNDKPGSNGPVASEHLRLLFERIERLKEEIKALNADVKDVYLEAKSVGFDTGTMKDVLKLRAMTPDDRRTKLSMIELYMAAVGIGEGSLSDMAADFLSDRFKPTEGDDKGGDDDGDGGWTPPPAPPAADGEPAKPPLTVEDATRLGKAAAAAGKPVTANPFPARDPRRAAWDQAWCQSAGSDGMEIPEFLQAPKKPGKDDKKDGK